MFRESVILATLVKRPAGLHGKAF